MAFLNFILDSELGNTQMCGTLVYEFSESLWMFKVVCGCCYCPVLAVP